MLEKIIVPNKLAGGYSRREFLRLLELAGVSVAIGGSGLMCGGLKTTDALAETADKGREVITRCGICGNDCGMKAYIKDNRIISVRPWKDDPESMGFMCSKGLATTRIVHAPDRILNPKTRVGDSWKDITWDEALNKISQKLLSLKKDPGPESLVVHYGVSQVRTPFYRYFIRRFSNVYGTPNFTGCGSQCAISSAMARAYSTGALASDYENARCIVLWGCNPSTSDMREWLRQILPAKDAGAKIICIDPRPSPMTKMADIHLRPRPGTDGALALSMANVIVAKGLHEEEFIKTYAVGFDQYQKLISGYTPKKAEYITGIPAADIENAALALSKNGPATISTGNGLELHTNGVQTIRSVMLLYALTGNIDVKGGGLIAGKKTALADMEMNKHQPFKAKGIMTDAYPLLWQKANMITANKVPEAILTGKPYPIKALMVFGGNPVITGPNASHMKEAYKRLELLVVMDLFMTETAKMADIVLPAATSLECDNLKATDRRIYMTPRVIAGQGNAWPVWRFWFELAKKMGYTAEFPWKTLDEAIDDHLSPIGVTASELRRNFNGIDHRAELAYKKFEKDGFHTPSGKIEFHSKTLADAGYDPLPGFVEPDHGSKNDISAKQYPLLMSSGARIPVYYHSQFHNIPSLRSKAPEPSLEINPTDATSLAIREGEIVAVTSPRGSIKVKATIVPSLSAGMIAMSHGWNEANVNELTDDAVLDPISGFPAYRGFLCRIEKA
ncbi:Anaerobic dehydrogenases [uncultured Desulfobacterium sp.]|uniref:Anaerobic dehydrogenases n=1 Tax=uncultured Desulfobacterium sp. TaxID=201089 RepID=A0A445N0T4_9BACT|nr:Anaerobic dehydrogenases [uncultured Desulfobacterium sp.]